MKPIYGTIQDNGGGIFTVLVDRDTEQYPPIGQRVMVVEEGWKPPAETIEVALDEDHVDMTRDLPPAYVMRIDAGNMHVQARIPKSTVLQYPELFERLVAHAVAIVRQQP